MKDINELIQRIEALGQPLWDDALAKVQVDIIWFAIGAIFFVGVGLYFLGVARWIHREKEYGHIESTFLMVALAILSFGIALNFAHSVHSRIVAPQTYALERIIPLK